MAQKIIAFSQTSYSRMHAGTDRYLLERVLFPQLLKQSHISGGSRGIQLPTGVGQDDEFISYVEAKNLVLEWLEQKGNLLESDKKKLQRLGSDEQFANIAYDYYQSRVEDSTTLATATRLQNLEALRSANNTTAISNPATFNSDQRIKDYNELYKKIAAYSTSGSAATILARLFPAGVSSASSLDQYILAKVIVENLPRLYRAGSHGNDSQQQDYSVAKELSHIISRSHPELTSYLNYLGDQNTQTTIRQFTNNLATQALVDDPNVLSKYELAQIDAGKSLEAHLLNETELRTSIFQVLTFVPNSSDRAKIADSILRGTIRGSLNPQQISHIVETLAISASEKTLVLNALNSSGVSISIDYKQGELYLLANNRHLTRGEIGLIKQGINPFLTTQSPSTQNATFKAKNLLDKYNLDHNQSFKTIDEAYAHERTLTKPDPLFLLHARSHINRNLYYQSLSGTDQNRVGWARVGRNFTNFRSRAYELQSKFSDRWVEIEETITGKKWLNKQLDRWDQFAEHFTVGKANIPIFRFRNWAIEQINQWKSKSTLNLIGKSGTWSSPLGKFFHSRITDYKLGGNTLKGMTFVGLNRAWSTLAYKASAGVVKQGALLSFRTATRFFLKIGAKSLAKASFKISQWAASTMLSLSGVFSAVGIALLVKDAIELVFGLGKWAWNNLKKIFPNGDGLAAGLVTAVAAGWTAGLGFVVGLLNPVVVPAIISLTVLFGIVFGSVHYQNMMTNMLQQTVRLDVNLSLDSGAGQLIGNILCEGGDSGGNQKAKTAACIVEILTKCGINPLTASNASGSSWQCVLASTLAQSAITTLQYSATNYSVLQCVGFIVAIDVATGGAGSGFGNANSLGTSPPSGYRYAAGVGSCSPGDFFVDTSGAWGHTGVFLGVSGPTIKCMDANGGGPGVVRGSESCTWLTSKVAGCLKKN